MLLSLSDGDAACAVVITIANFVDRVDKMLRRLASQSKPTSDVLLVH